MAPVGGGFRLSCFLKSFISSENGCAKTCTTEKIIQGMKRKYLLHFITVILGWTGLWPRHWHFHFYRFRFFWNSVFVKGFNGKIISTVLVHRFKIILIVVIHHYIIIQLVRGNSPVNIITRCPVYRDPLNECIPRIVLTAQYDELFHSIGLLPCTFSKSP